MNRMGISIDTMLSRYGKTTFDMVVADGSHETNDNPIHYILVLRKKVETRESNWLVVTGNAITERCWTFGSRESKTVLLDKTEVLPVWSFLSRISDHLEQNNSDKATCNWSYSSLGMN